MNNYRILLALSLFFFSCGKCPEKNKEKHAIDPAVLNFLSFYQEQKTWVYEDEAKTATDSIYVAGLKQSYEVLTDECVLYQKITFDLYSKVLVNGESVTMTFSVLKSDNGLVSAINMRHDPREGMSFGLFSTGKTNEKPGFSLPVVDTIINGQLYKGSLLDTSTSTNGVSNKILSPEYGIVSYKKGGITYNLKN
ncbi:MAG: hypothetical protein V4616_10695 [Bacteroidota bacterium]